ncbi:PTS sugar transporter subunit IIA [Amphibacillus sp. Q70]|uniref:PTS sugar transporter subunit IIA n=1 Tax=Amphibacillus sp. Q70 TaxID=3453416 RepID=UPI003F870A53
MLKELLPYDRCQSIAQVDSWEEAIRVASEPLLRDESIELEYVEQMIESVNKHGPYIILMDYFALPHARAGVEVNELSMSLLKLENPIDLKGNQVKVFLVLAAIDNESHLKALAEVSEKLADQKNYDQFIWGSLEDAYSMLIDE